MSEESGSIAENDVDDSMETQNTIPLQKHKRRSYIWKYFSPVPDHVDVFRCNVCDETFGNKMSNLGRHLLTAHSITENRQEDAVKKGRPNRSFVWNFCTKLDEKRALCHICKKVLYFGGGNTSNITKHLRRMHSDKLQEVAKHLPRSITWGTEQGPRRDRRGTSYVWNYCERQGKNIVLCKLCNSRMRFHGTANVITHLQRRHGIVDETTAIKLEVSENVQDAATSSTNEGSFHRSYRRSCISGSMVWRYIRRISDEVVRCRVCLKNLSYQGTSNLQRHLHRMHNIVWSGQEQSGPIKAEAHQSDENSFFDFCEATSDPLVWKCQMCDEHFEQNEKFEETVGKHMIKIHSAAMRGESFEDFAAEEEEGELTTLYSDVVTEDDTSTTEQVPEQMDLANSVAEDALYDDIIEVEEGAQDVEETEENVVSDYSNDSTDAQLVTTTIQADDTPRIRELKEDLLRQQAIYFSEKAGFYRMQKFLVAQQVQKERLEIEKLKAEQTHNADS